MRSFITMAILTPITIPVIVVGVATYFGLAKLSLIGTETGIYWRTRLEQSAAGEFRQTTRPGC